MIKFLQNSAKIVKMEPLNKNTYDISKNIKNTLENLTKRAEYEMSDDFHYKNIDESIVNDGKGLNCKAIAFTISQDKDKYSGHLLELSMLHKSMQRELTRPLTYGTKQQILDFLKSKDVFKNIKKDIDDLSNEL